jgi:hypothetical protein
VQWSTLTPAGQDELARHLEYAGFAGSDADDMLPRFRRLEELELEAVGLGWEREELGYRLCGENEHEDILDQVVDRLIAETEQIVVGLR